MLIFLRCFLNPFPECISNAGLFIAPAETITSLPASINCEAFLSASSSEVLILEITFYWVFLSLDFHELWGSVMSVCLLTEVKRQWVTLVLGWVTASVHYL